MKKKREIFDKENDKKIDIVEDELAMIQLRNKYFKMKYIKNERQISISEKILEREKFLYEEEEKLLEENEFYLRGTMAQSYLNPFGKPHSKNYLNMVKSKSCSDIMQAEQLAEKGELNEKQFMVEFQKLCRESKVLENEEKRLMDLENFMQKEIRKLEAELE